MMSIMDTTMNATTIDAPPKDATEPEWGGVWVLLISMVFVYGGA
jgi:hypothetical protein